MVRLRVDFVSSSLRSVCLKAFEDPARDSIPLRRGNGLLEHDPLRRSGCWILSRRKRRSCRTVRAKIVQKTFRRANVAGFETELSCIQAGGDGCYVEERYRARTGEIRTTADLLDDVFHFLAGFLTCSVADTALSQQRHCCRRLHIAVNYPARDARRACPPRAKQLAVPEPADSYYAIDVIIGGGTQTDCAVHDVICSNSTGSNPFCVASRPCPGIRQWELFQDSAPASRLHEHSTTACSTASDHLGKFLCGSPEADSTR